jgi:hypothetical protein
MKDIYEFLCEINVDSSKVEEMEVSEFEREKGKRKLMSSLKKRKSSKKKIVLAVASLVLISLVSVTVVTPTWAESIPIIGELMKERLVDVNKQYEDYMNTVGQTKSQDGIDVTFENVVADNNMFAFSLVVKNNNDEIKDLEGTVIPISVKVNGNEINTGGGYECKPIDKNTVKCLYDISWDYKDLPRYLNVEMVISELFGKKGDWKVKFSMDTKDVKNNIYTEKIDKNFTIDGIKFNLDEINISPLTTNIKCYGESDDIDFLVLDQNGEQVKSLGGLGEYSEDGEEGKMKFSFNYINSKNLTSLKLIPLYCNKNEVYEGKSVGSKKINLEKFIPFEFNLPNNLSMNIESCNVEKENLIVKYNYKYAGKKIVGLGGKDFDIKASGNLLEESEDMNLYEKYQSEGSFVRIYKINNTKEIEMEFNDQTANMLIENEATIVTKK